MSEGQVVTLIIAAAGGMTTAVGFLFKNVIGLHEKQSVMSEQIGELKGREEGIKNLSAQVLETVHRAVNGDDE